MNINLEKEVQKDKIDRENQELLQYNVKRNIKNPKKDSYKRKTYAKMKLTKV